MKLFVSNWQQLSPMGFDLSDHLEIVPYRSSSLELMSVELFSLSLDNDHVDLRPSKFSQSATSCK